ncbi:hypothetical protein GCM10010236_70010 [Streptomyces eurythermus]|nr:hypothetical protein GCM10010236_70010 [Streptomyces eurythermus]
MPGPGAIGIFGDVGSDVGGLVDVLLLPERAERRPGEGTVTGFGVWWADGRRQVRLEPSGPRYPRETSRTPRRASGPAGLPVSAALSAPASLSGGRTCPTADRPDHRDV